MLCSSSRVKSAVSGLDLPLVVLFRCHSDRSSAHRSALSHEAGYFPNGRSIAAGDAAYAATASMIVSGSVLLTALHHALCALSR